MDQNERRLYLIQTLLQENQQYHNMKIPQQQAEQKKFLRSLMNVRPPKPVGEEFLAIQDAYLSDAINQKGITNLSNLQPIQDGIYLWQGDITTLQVDAIVNAANSQMLGCFRPCHGCIDNVIHTYSGVQLRLACAQIMEKQGHEEETGSAKITPAFNLPCKFVLHTVGPIILGELTQNDCKLLASCYRSCLELAEQNQIKSIAFCCISTGVFHFPHETAAQIAIDTVFAYKEHTKSTMEVVFNVFQIEDYEIYQRLLSGNNAPKR